MRGYRRVLKIFATIVLVFAFALAVGGIALIAASPTLGDIVASAFREAAAGELADVHFESEITGFAVSIAVAFVAVLVLIYAGLLMTTGFLGRRGAKHPDKLTAFLVFNIVMFVIDFGVFLLQGVAHLTGDVTAIALLMPAFFQVTMFVCAVSLRRGLRTGKYTMEDAKRADAEADARPRLGFIRVIQVLFSLNIVISLGMCVTFVSGKSLVGVPEYIAFFNLVADGVAFWLILQRFSTTRKWIITVSTINIVVGTIAQIIAGDVSLFERLFNCSFDILLVLYFTLAKKPKELLTRKFTLKGQKEGLADAWALCNIKSLDFWRAMVIYFCLFSIVGHWMEVGFCTLIKYGIVQGTYDPTSGVWRDYLSPFPVYGAGMVACGLILYPIKTKLAEKLGGIWKPLVVSTIVTVAVVVVLELVLGFTQNADHHLWDYSDIPFNFQGQICLQNTIAFAAVATLITWVVYPALQKGYLSLSKDLKTVIFIVVIVFYAMVVCLYIINKPIVGFSAFETAP